MKVYELDEKLQEIIKEDRSYAYEYKYYYGSSNGDLHRDYMKEDTYGNSRKGFEQFKRDNPLANIQHSGVIYLRPFTIKDSNGNIKEEGVVCETKIESDKSEINKQLASLEKEVWEYFCEIFKLDNPVKESLASKVMSIDNYLNKVPKEKIAWCLEQIKDRESFCGNELDEVTELLIDIGELK